LQGARPTREDKRMHLECEMIMQFRNAGAAFLTRDDVVDIYFVAQHFGMPTRLLDWSTNSLAALFFACGGGASKDGVVYAMNAREVIPQNACLSEGARLYRSVMSVRHPFVKYAVEISFWAEPREGYNAYILPVMPDVLPGRIGQQSSCFTLHMHKAPDVRNETAITILIAAREKLQIRDQLLRLNINEFTIYYDLDHLSKEIRRCWGLGS